MLDSSEQPHPCVTCGAMPIDSREESAVEFVRDAEGSGGQWARRRWTVYTYPCEQATDHPRWTDNPRSQDEALERWRALMPK